MMHQPTMATAHFIASAFGRRRAACHTPLSIFSTQLFSDGRRTGAPVAPGATSGRADDGEQQTSPRRAYSGRISRHNTRPLRRFIKWLTISFQAALDYGAAVSRLRRRLMARVDLLLRLIDDDCGLSPARATII